MFCIKCEDIICLSAFSSGNCNICNKEIVTPYIPCYEVCEECSVDFNVCEQCGKSYY